MWYGQSMRTIEDEREIQYLSNGMSSWQVGFMGVTKIEPYEENGHCAAITWFAIYHGPEIGTRVTGLNMEVGYAS
jgi:hypothetical protein